MMTGFAVLKIVLMPSSTRRVSLANSGPRWSMIGMSMARMTRSGMGVGPGICRKWRPAARDELVAIGMFLVARCSACSGRAAAKAGGGPYKTSLVNYNRKCSQARAASRGAFRAGGGI